MSTKEFEAPPVRMPCGHGLETCKLFMWYKGHPRTYYLDSDDWLRIQKELDEYLK